MYWGRPVVVVPAAGVHYDNEGTARLVADGPPPAFDLPDGFGTAG